MADERRYRRLLRWYPRAWRERNGEVLLAVMLDEAERLGHARPTVGEQCSVIAHGLGARLDTRLALRCGYTALVLAAVAMVSLLLIPQAIRSSGMEWMALVAASLSLILIATGFLGVLRERGPLPEPHALLAGVAGAVALSVGELAWAAWLVGFEAADQGDPVPPFGRLFGPLFLVAWVVGAAAIAVIVDGLLAGTHLARSLRIMAGLGLGFIVAPFVEFLASAPGVPIGAAGVLVLVALALRRPSSPSERA